jgi:diguanylate cyclase (GGDEF)-like protein
MTGAMGAAFYDLRWGLRVSLAAGASVVAAMIAVLLVDLAADAGTLGSDVHRWCAPAAGLLACCSIFLRVVRVERERRAWTLLAVGLTSFCLGSLLWASVWAQQPEVEVPSPADAMWLAFFPAAYAAIVSLLRRSFVRAPASMWLDGLLAALAFSSIGIAVIFHPLVESGTGSTAAVASQVAYPIADLLLVALVLAVVAMSGWHPGQRWLTLGAAMLAWFVADTANLNAVAGGGTITGGVSDPLWTAGLLLMALAAWQEPNSPEGLRVEGLRMLLAPAIFSAVALGFLVFDRFHPTNDVSSGLALAAVAVALARTTMTLREIQMLAQARHESLTDELTGLPSRRHFHRRLSVALREAADEELPLGLLLFDLDRFKDLNDTLGHSAGDTLLELVGRRLRESLGRATLVARLGGDEFAVLLPPGQGHDAAARAGARVIEAIERPFEVEGLELDIGASVGIALFPDHATDEEELVRRADVAMYLAKGAGGGVAFYDPERDLHTRDRLALGRQLRGALTSGELTLFYQPKADPQLGRVLGVEALVRWQHPAHGLLTPPDFVPLAARSGLMPQLTRFVLGEALAQLALWRADGFDLTVAVNLAVTDLLDDDLPRDVGRMLAARDVPPTCLALEVTEDGLIADPDNAAQTLDAIARLGVRIALDDFGTGWSSLAHLRRLPVDELKIDRSFIRDMARDDEDAAIVRTTIDLARSLRLRVVAEGVEDDETWSLLADLGCDAIQGFVLSRPLPGPQIGSWLATRRDGGVARCVVPFADEPEPGLTRYRL